MNDDTRRPIVVQRGPNNSVRLIIKEIVDGKWTERYITFETTSRHYIRNLACMLLDAAGYDGRACYEFVEMTDKM